MHNAEVKKIFENDWTSSGYFGEEGVREKTLAQQSSVRKAVFLTLPINFYESNLNRNSYLHFCFYSR